MIQSPFYELTNTIATPLNRITFTKSGIKFLVENLHVVHFRNYDDDSHKNGLHQIPAVGWPLRIVCLRSITVGATKTPTHTHVILEYRRTSAYF